MPAHLAVIYHVVKTGASVVTAVVRVLDDSADSFLGETAETHRDSAAQAFETAAKMNDAQNRNSELLVANGHLRYAFNAYRRFVSRQRSMLSAFTGGGVSQDRKVDALSRCVEIATLIALTYAEAGEEANARDWMEKAWRQFALYELNYRKLAKGKSYRYNPDPHRKLVFDEPSFQEQLQRLESERRELGEIFHTKGIA